MRWSRAVAEVTRWEFRRYVKPRQQLIGMLLTFVIFGGFMAAGRLAARRDAGSRDVAIIGSDVLPVRDIQPTTIRFILHERADEATLRERVRDGSLQGLLVIRDVDHAELVLRRRPSWIGEMQTLLGAARQQHMIERAGVSAASLAAILTPPQLELTYAEGTAGHTRGERFSIIVVVSLMLMAVFIGMSYIFASITGEKQIRVTEQVVSAIPAQAWIDGKILGLMAVSIVSVLAQVVAFAAVYLLIGVFLDGPALPIPDSLGQPAVVALILVYAMLGLFFWFAFLGAVAATIDDPHNSARGSLLFVPMFASGMAFLVLGDPNSGMSRTLALLPPTAPSAMPVRLLMTEVGALELMLSMALLVGAIAMLRIAAGRIFRIAMLMYGKEPSWAELRRWAAGR